MLLTECGFSIKEVRSDELCLTVVVSKLDEDTKFTSMSKAIDTEVEEFKSVIDKHGDFCVYGAGHYSQMLLCKVYNKYGVLPKYIYDSNAQKCRDKKFFGVDVIHKDNIKPCDTIIAMCGMYNDEVYDYLIAKGIFKEVIKWD